MSQSFTISFPFRTPALRVCQPLGTYYVAVLPARLLLDVAFSDVMSATARADGSGYDLSGTQRLKQPKRLSQIADYIERSDAAFPNAIILAGNFRPDTGLIEDDQEADDDGAAETGSVELVTAPERHRQWEIVEDGSQYTLVIPTPDKLAAIIDGQHRLFAFTEVSLAGRLTMDLVCSIFLDLPKPYQAQLFATINSTQKPVDKSLTYELFGYNISDESPLYWTPDKLAVLLTRKLGTEEVSPLRGRIIIAPKKDDILSHISSSSNWKVSTAVIVEGIMRLVTSNPKRDSNFLLSAAPKERSSLSNAFRDKSILRNAYLGGNDNLIYTIVLNYLKACQAVFWGDASSSSFITRTVGVQALFDVLRKLLPDALEATDIRQSYFESKLAEAGNLDFSDEEYRKASGSGRLVIRRAIESAILWDSLV